jgi:ATP-binding cassette, subfamily B, bacterial PglK
MLKLSSFINLRQKIYLLIFFFNQIILSLIEMLSLSLIPIFIFYLQDLKAAELKIQNINSYLNLEILTLDINLIMKYGFFLLIILFIIKNIILIIISYFELHIIKDITRVNLNRLYVKYIDEKFNVLIKKNYASFMRNLISEVAKSTAYIIAHINILKEIIMLVAVFTVLLLNDFSISLFVLGFFVIVSLIVVLFLKDRLFKKGSETLEAKSRLIDNVFNSLNVIKEMKIYKIENFFIKQMDKNFNLKLRNDMYKTFVTRLPRNIFELLLIVLFVSIVIFTYLTRDNLSTILPMMVMLVLASLRILPSFSIIIQSYTSLRYSRASFDNISLELNEKINDKAVIINKYPVNYDQFEELNFKNLSFKYNDEYTFKNLTFDIKKNKVTGIIGKTGSGKSTLLNIIIGLLDFHDGEVHLNNKKIDKDFKLDFSIGYVPQDTFLTDGTIAENIAIGNNKKKFDYDRINKVINFCELKDFVDSLTDGVDSQIGQKGSFLSGGQRQRINIARALYRNPDLLILDESTNALDNKTKIKLMKKIKNHKSKFTVLIVTHDNDLLEYFDEIIDLDKKFN